MASAVSAQQWKKFASIEFEQNIEQVSIDRQGNIYLEVASGAIEKYDRNGVFQRHFSPNKKSNPSLIEAWQGLRVFVFYKDFQEYLFLDRLMNSSERYTLDNQKISGYSSIATLAADNNLWVLDAQALSLKKIDISNQEIIIETFLSLNLSPPQYDFTTMREYQNLLFIGDRKNGVLVFDNIGNYIETLPIAGVDYFSFNETNLIAQKGNKLILFDIYKRQKKEVSLPDSSTYSFVLMENTRVFLFGTNKLDIYELN
ncbi:MAG: hypothetical protein COW03_02915 [Cytophagales bacterium CG12_big_fil_rev_8_21_14_0_65_40_12]|nr:MAG: hypothetical protein COW03_02915 [Cytophagales bacterium CG12_big_fil_rev_8_21_14_0_65_40_12]PIW05985.1 MAG: hypothetical protein COW40_01730 [Cytophagales bacterium CG17_big_fil_post_rev_8_21_14_2_50_40_13]